MESLAHALRYRLIFGKFRVKAVTKGLTGQRFDIDLGNSITITVDAPIRADVKLGDLLTLYTEVLCHDQPDPAPVQ